MSMDILRATKLKYGAIHSADPKQMCFNNTNKEVYLCTYYRRQLDRTQNH